MAVLGLGSFSVTDAITQKASTRAAVVAARTCGGYAEMPKITEHPQYASLRD